MVIRDRRSVKDHEGRKEGKDKYHGQRRQPQENSRE